MWPFDLHGAHECLRIGCNAVERWVSAPPHLQLVARQPLPPTPRGDPVGLTVAIRALYADRPSKPVTLLIESAWMPTLLVDIGKDLLNPDQVRSLVRHRLDLLYESEGAPASDWQVRVDYTVGRRLALGFGISHALRSTLVDIEATGLKWQAILPAFAWGLDHLKRVDRSVSQSGWWLWPEQDRLMVAQITAAEVVSLNSCVDFTEDPNELRRIVATECACNGVVNDNLPIVAGTWSPAGLDDIADSSGLKWIRLAAPHDASAGTLGGAE